jgi:hypothetical protein
MMTDSVEEINEAAHEKTRHKDTGQLLLSR